jgi:site-specific DNA recombinase
MQVSSEYAASNELEHPRNVFLREDLVLPELDSWLVGLFTRLHLPGTIKALVEAHEMDVDPGRSAIAGGRPTHGRRR